MGCACCSHTGYIPALAQEWFRLVCLHTCHALGQSQDSARLDFPHTCHVPEPPSNGVVTQVLNHTVSPNSQLSTEAHLLGYITFPSAPTRVGLSILVLESAGFQQHHVLAQASLSTSLSSLNPVKVWASPRIRESHVSVPLCCSAFDNHVLFRDCKVGGSGSPASCVLAPLHGSKLI